MPFENAVFIKSHEPFDRGYHETNNAPVYAVDFTVTEEVKTAELHVCALGIGYAYINGKWIGDDLFSPPLVELQQNPLVYDLRREGRGKFRRFRKKPSCNSLRKRLYERGYSQYVG